MTTATAWQSDYGEHEAAMVAYREAGTARARALDNRGPIRYDADGKLHDDIVESYWRHGFYVFEGVISEDEQADIERDVLAILDRAPTEPRGKLDRLGRPALGADGKGGGMAMVRPLSDPIGGTTRNNGRHPAKMIELLASRNSESTLAASSSSMTRPGDGSTPSETSASSGESTSPSMVSKGRAMWTGPGRPDVAMSRAFRMSLGRPEGLCAVHEAFET